MIAIAARKAHHHAGHQFHLHLNHLLHLFSNPGYGTAFVVALIALGLLLISRRG